MFLGLKDENLILVLIGGLILYYIFTKKREGYEFTKKELADLYCYPMIQSRNGDRTYYCGHPPTVPPEYASMPRASPSPACNSQLLKYW